MRIYELLTRNLDSSEWDSVGLYFKEKDAKQAWSDIMWLWSIIEEHKIQERIVYGQ